MSPPSRLSVVIPAYNESKRLPETLRALPEFSALLKKNQLILYEVLCVNDGSKDSTPETVQRLAQELPEIPIRLVSYEFNQGKGHAIRTGAQQAGGDLILVADADMSTPWPEFFKLYTALQEGSDLAIASRSSATSQIQIRQPWYREKMGKTFNFLLKSITGLPFRDTQCGFKLMKINSTRPLWFNLHVNRFAWDVEFLMLANRSGLKISEIGVVWNHKEESRVHPLWDSLEMLSSVIRIRIGQIFLSKK